MTSVTEFRQMYPEFTEEMYPTVRVQMRLNLGEKFFSQNIWEDSDIRTHVINLYTAHYLLAGGTAGVEGGSSASLGVVASKSVDGASVSYDTSSVAENGAGFWNATAYGRELYQLMRLMGAGARQI